MSSSFDRLHQFISKQMRMSHIYQPAMILQLLVERGRCSINSIAKSFLNYDQSQIEYYEEVTKKMPAKVLDSHNIIEKENNDYVLIGFGELKDSEIQELRRLCVEKLEEYIEKRGENIWEHRTLASGNLSGTLKLQILERAKMRCELCGISNEKKALEVDHILPRTLGGTDDLWNLQALCYSCNAMKSNRSKEDYRKIKKSYDDRKQGCLFCETGKERIIDENELAYAIEDKFPVTKHHLLIIPKRHINDYFGLYQSELNAIHELLQRHQLLIKEQDATVTGFNVGSNNGEDSGQTIFHCHVHLIPRRKNDTENPKGGVRGVIAKKQNY